MPQKPEPVSDPKYVIIFCIPTNGLRTFEPDITSVIFTPYLTAMIYRVFSMHFCSIALQE
jgi:hypothetical protein